MLFSYLTIAARNLKKRVGPTLINVVGLTVGIAACLLIGLWVERELSFDDFHPEAERIYRIGIESRITDAMIRTSAVPAPVTPALQSDVPQVEAVTRFRPNRVIFQRGDLALSERLVLPADSNFFAVFGGFELLRGSRATALDDTDALVLTETTAREIFGRTDVLGETVRMDDAVRRVTGVMADIPETSHLQFDAVSVSQGAYADFEDNWTGYVYFTYAKLKEGSSQADINDGLAAIVENRAMSDVIDRFGEPSDNFVYRIFADAMPSIHLYSDLRVLGPSGSIATVTTFSLIGLFILLIACINFMNLATARATERATEVGMRKALGAGRNQLAGQFLGEALLLTTIATVAAFVVAAAALPVFNSLAGTSMGVSTLLQPGTLLGGVGLILVVGLIAGSYPAFALSRFAPATVLKASGKQSTGGQGERLRKGLVVFQFAISITLIIGTLIANEQFEFIQSKRLGMDKERVVEIERADDLGPQQETFVDRIRTTPGVTAASLGDGMFGGISGTAFVPFSGGVGENADYGEPQALRYLKVDFQFVESMGIDIVEGRSFDPARSADSSAVVLNQAAVDVYGWDEPIGKRVASCDSGCTFDVIGVVDNFHFQSMRSEVEPLALVPRDPTGGTDRQESLYARLAPGQTQEALGRIQSVWTSIAGAAPFQYTFLDQTYDQVHRDVQRAGDLFRLFAIVAVLIACLGLFGLATYTVQRRAKEIGIRKALGATASQVVMLLSTEFVQLVALAFVVGVPVAYFGMQQWLADFAYRASLGVDLFLLAGVLAFGIAVLTISTQAFRAARLDPATTLRDE